MYVAVLRIELEENAVALGKAADYLITGEFLYRKENALIVKVPFMNKDLVGAFRFILKQCEEIKEVEEIWIDK